MQDDVAELLRSAARDHANTKVRAPPPRFRLFTDGWSPVAPLRVWTRARVLASVRLQPLCLLRAGQPGADPVRAERHRGGSAPADRAGGLPQPAHGELTAWPPALPPGRRRGGLIGRSLPAGLRAGADRAVL